MNGWNYINYSANWKIKIKAFIVLLSVSPDLLQSLVKMITWNMEHSLGVEIQKLHHLFLTYYQSVGVCFEG